jgi:release factor glutamine methyltransferase
LTEPDVVRRLRAAGCVFAEDEAALLIAEAESAVQLERLVELRVAGRPLEHLLGWAEFCGRRVEVQAGVFVPRRRTELLATVAGELVRPGSVLLELCCGCAAVATVLADAGSIEVHAADLDRAAVDCARRNLAPAAGSVYLGDLFDPLPDSLRGRVDVLVANAPYVPSEAIALMPPEAREYEPRLALDGGPDGLAVQRRIIAQAPDWLAGGGWLLIETSDRQAAGTARAMAGTGLSTQVRTETSATVVLGQLGLAQRLPDR